MRLAWHKIGYNVHKPLGIVTFERFFFRAAETPLTWFTPISKLTKLGSQLAAQSHPCLSVPCEPRSTLWLRARGHLCAILIPFFKDWSQKHLWTQFYCKPPTSKNKILSLVHHGVQDAKWCTRHEVVQQTLDKVVHKVSSVGLITFREGSLFMWHGPGDIEGGEGYVTFFFSKNV